jgi:hypothetical protein
MSDKYRKVVEQFCCNPSRMSDEPESIFGEMLCVHKPEVGSITEQGRRDEAPVPEDFAIDISNPNKG